MKTIKIKEKTHYELMQFKTRWQNKSFDELFKLLMEYYEISANDKIRK